MSKINIDDIAKRLGGEIKGGIDTIPGCIGAMKMVEDIKNKIKESDLINGEWIYVDGENGHIYPRDKNNVRNEKTWLGDGAFPRAEKEEKRSFKCKGIIKKISHGEESWENFLKDLEDRISEWSDDEKINMGLLDCDRQPQSSPKEEFNLIAERTKTMRGSRIAKK